jgi:hypothetical protein
VSYNPREPDRADFRPGRNATTGAISLASEWRSVVTVDIAIESSRYCRDGPFHGTIGFRFDRGLIPAAKGGTGDFHPIAKVFRHSGGLKSGFRWVISCFTERPAIGQLHNAFKLEIDAISELGNVRHRLNANQTDRPTVDCGTISDRPVVFVDNERDVFV